MGKLSAVSYQLSAIASRFKSSPGHAGCDRRPRRRCSTWTWARREGRRLPPPPLLDSPGHDNHFSFRELDVALAELNSHLALQNEKELVLLLVLVPDEFPLKLDEVSAGRSPALPTAVGLPSVVGPTAQSLTSPMIFGLQ